MKRVLALLLAVLTVLTGAGCTAVAGTGGKGYVDADTAIVRVPVADRGDPIELTGTDLEGEPVDLASYRGKPLVINIWGHWCGPCVRETPLLVGAAKALSGRAAFLGITSREADTVAPLAFVRANGIPYPSIFDREGKALLAFRGASAPTGTPFTLVLDADGRYAAAWGEVTSQATLVDLVDDVAAGK